MTVSSTHLVLLPSYNTGPRLRAVVAEVLRHWQPVLVVVDGSTDGSEQPLLALAQSEPALTVLVRPQNSGKGAAVLAGAEAAAARGFTHALVMDADGQHPAASIAEFMTASQARPEALVLGKPVFPANIPAERLHGRKLSVWMVRVEMLGAGIDDPLFGFRIYPLAPLLAALGSRHGGRRYDFDTEAAVRMCWAGVPPVNRSAPVRYFSQAEGGISHFHYLRDNLTLVGMHLRLVAELLLVRWPALLRHRRAWRAAGVALVLLMVGATLTPAAEPDPLVNTEQRLAAGASGWSDLVATFSNQPDTTADFSERRFFPFRKDPVALRGEVRISTARGLSLRYLEPESRIVILDDQGMIVRSETGEQGAPMDPRAGPANAALRHILRFDFNALEADFELYGRRDADQWTLALVPRSAELRRGIGRITVTGDATTVRRIELRRSARQYIEILINAPRPREPFSPDDVKKFFR